MLLNLKNTQQRDQRVFSKDQFPLSKSAYAPTEHRHTAHTKQRLAAAQSLSHIFMSNKSSLKIYITDRKELSPTYWGELLVISQQSLYQIRGLTTNLSMSWLQTMPTLSPALIQIWWDRFEKLKMDKRDNVQCRLWFFMNVQDNPPQGMNAYSLGIIQSFLLRVTPVPLIPHLEYTRIEIHIKLLASCSIRINKMVVSQVIMLSYIVWGIERGNYIWCTVKTFQAWK